VLAEQLGHLDTRYKPIGGFVLGEAIEIIEYIIEFSCVDCTCSSMARAYMAMGEHQLI
jgi:hypothetical protein